MARVPYEVVAIEADRIIMKMVIASSWDEATYYWDVYLGYITACGWNNKSYDEETLKRVDNSWDSKCN